MVACGIASHSHWADARCDAQAFRGPAQGAGRHTPPRLVYLWRPAAVSGPLWVLVRGHCDLRALLARQGLRFSGWQCKELVAGESGRRGEPRARGAGCPPAALTTNRPWQTTFRKSPLHHVHSCGHSIARCLNRGAKMALQTRSMVSLRGLQLLVHCLARSLALTHVWPSAAGRRQALPPGFQPCYRS